MGGHGQGHQVRNRFTAQGIEHGASCRKRVRHVAGVAIALQRRKPFSSANVDFDALLLESLKLFDEFPRSRLEPRVFDHAQHAVIERNGLAAAMSSYELADFALEELDGLRPHV